MSTVYKRPTGYYLSWYCAPGCPTHPAGHKQHCVSLRTKDGKKAETMRKEKDRALQAAKAQAALSLPPAPLPADPWTVKQFIDTYELRVKADRAVSAATWERAESWALGCLLKYRPHATLDELTAAWITDYERHEKARLSPHSWNSQRRTLKALGTRVVGWQWLPANPFLALTPAKAKKKRPKRLFQEQIPVIIAAIPNQFWRLVTLFLYATGVRRQELCNLERSHVRRQQGFIEIETNKENEPKVIALTPEIDWIVTEAEKIASSRYVFSRDGKQLHYEAVKNYYRWISRKVKFTVSTHRFRHSHGTHRMEAGDNLKTVSSTLGHADIRTTANFYLDIDLPAQRAALSRLPIAQLVTLTQTAPIAVKKPKEKRQKS
jgi:integrase/recombinase XerD